MVFYGTCTKTTTINNLKDFLNTTITSSYSLPYPDLSVLYWDLWLDLTPIFGLVLASPYMGLPILQCTIYSSINVSNCSEISIRPILRQYEGLIKCTTNTSASTMVNVLGCYLCLPSISKKTKNNNRL